VGAVTFQTLFRLPNVTRPLASAGGGPAGGGSAGGRQHQYVSGRRAVSSA